MECETGKTELALAENENLDAELPPSDDNVSDTNCVSNSNKNERLVFSNRRSTTNLKFKQLSCRVCGSIYTTSHGFRKHLQAHKKSSELGGKYDCPKCKYPTASEGKLRYHLTKAHLETNKNTCSICGYVGSRRWVYDKHMKEKVLFYTHIYL